MKKLSEGEETFALHCKAYGLTPEREYRFAPTGRYRFDFAFPEAMIAVEIEGGTWSKGRHTRPKGFEEDCRKYNLAAIFGWRVLRFTSDMVYSAEAINTTYALVTA